MKHPETTEELAEAGRLAVEAIEEEPWWSRAETPLTPQRPASGLT
jgi:hypothetical protein